MNGNSPNKEDADCPRNPFCPVSSNAIHELMESCAAKGAERVLASLGLFDDNAKRDIEDIRGLLASFRGIKREIWKGLLRATVKAFFKTAKWVVYLCILAALYTQEGRNLVAKLLALPTGH